MEFDDFIEFRLVNRSVPKDAVGTVDTEVEGWSGLAEDGAAAVGREKVKIFVNVVSVMIRVGVSVGRFGSPSFWWDLDEE